jgi:REP element-mobilizing transposase RayT
MTSARQISADQTFEVISRCISRLFLLAPSYEVTQTFLYVLGHYAKKHGVTLYALVLMANHYHLLGLDKHGNLPHFMRDLNSFVARVLNHGYGRDDKFWSGDGYHIVRLIKPEDVWAWLMYITSNPSNADLVVRTQDYPGFVTTPGKIGKPICTHRPSFFREDGVMLETAEVVFEVPACLELSHDEYVARFDREFRDAEFSAKR